MGMYINLQTQLLRFERTVSDWFSPLTAPLPLTLRSLSAPAHLIFGPAPLHFPLLLPLRSHALVDIKMLATSKRLYN